MSHNGCAPLISFSQTGGERQEATGAYPSRQTGKSKRPRHSRWMLILLRASTVSSQEAHNSAPLRSLACGRCMQQRAHGARIRAGGLPLLGPRPQVGAAALQVAPQRRQDVARVAARRASERLVRPTKRSTAAAVCAAGCCVRCSSCMRHRPGAKVPAVVQWCSTQRPWQAHAHQQLRSCRLWSPACQSSQKIQPESSCSYMRIHAKMQTSGVACTAPPCTQTLPWLPALLSSNLHAMVYSVWATLHEHQKIKVFVRQSLPGNGPKTGFFASQSPEFAGAGAAAGCT